MESNLFAENFFKVYFKVDTESRQPQMNLTVAGED